MLLEQRDDGVRIIRIHRPEDALPYRAAFAGAYQDIFSEPPYNERFFPSEAQGVLRGYLEIENNLTLLAVKGRSSVVGFGIGIPAMAKHDISRELLGLLPVQHTFYLAELGVLSSARSSGLGRSLVSWRLRIIDRDRFTHVALRTSAVRNASYEMYMGMGFDDMGVYMEVPSRRLDGRVRTDRRLFLSKLLTRSDVGEPSSDENTWGAAAKPGG